MELIYENSSFIHSTVASGNLTEVQENKRKPCSSTWTKVLLIGLTVSLVFALGGLCFLSILYANVSVQLSAQESNGKIMARELEELEVNYTRIREDLHRTEAVMARELEKLTVKNTRVTEDLLIHEVLTAQSSNCDVTLGTFHEKLYFFSCDKLTWSSSRDFCVSRGADLVTITSQEEQTFLHSKVTAFHWIGLTDLETEGRWVWVNNQTLNETGVQFWHQRKSQKSEPDNWKQEDPSGENCAIVTNDFSSKDSWFDGSCKNKLKFICEKKY